MWLLAACAVPLSTIRNVIATYVPVPFWDQWFEIRWYQAYLDGTAPLTTLWRLHNEHNIFFPRLTFLADLSLLHGTNVSLLVWCLVIPAVTCALLIREARLAPGLGKGTVAFLAGVYVMLLFSFTQMENFVSPFQVQFVLVVGAPVAAFVCVADAVDRRDHPRAALGWLGLSSVCGFVATFSMANGVLVWPLLLLAAWVGGLPRRAVLGLGVVALCTMALWYADRAAIGVAPAGPYRIDRALVFLTLYLGAPLAALSEEASGIVGTLGLCLGIGLSLVAVRRGRALSRFERVSLLILWFTLASAAATTLGRSEWGHTIALVSRYATTSLVFWASAVSLLVYLVAQLERGRRFALPLVLALVAGGLVLLLTPAHIATARQAQRDVEKKRMGELALVVGVDDAYLGSLFPERDTLLGLRPFLAEQRLAPFVTEWPHWVGRRMSDVLDLASAPDVTGRFANARVHVAPFGTPDADAGVRVRGWAWNEATTAAPALVVLADDSGIIRGFARPNARPDAVDALYGARATPAAAWFGYARTDGSRPLRAYALSADGRSAHALAGVQFAGNLTVHRSPVAAGAWQSVGEWTPQPRAQVGSRFVGGYAFGSPRARQVGTLYSEAFTPGDAGYLLVPFTTGPDTAGAQLYVVDAETERVVARCDLTDAVPVWVVWTIPISAGFPQAVVIRVADAGDSPDQWIAIGQPRLVSPPTQ